MTGKEVKKEPASLHVPSKPKTWGDLRAMPSSFSKATTESSHSTSLEDDFNYGVHVSSCALEVRMQFLRKVYGIVSFQLLTTCLVAAFFRIPSISAFVQTWLVG